MDDGDLTIEKIVTDYDRSIYNFVFRLIGNEEDALDATQEVFIKVWKNLDKYDIKQSFRPWIFKIARNTTIDWLRRRRNIPFSRLDYQNEEGDSQYFADTLADEGMLPDEVFAQTEIKEKFMEALTAVSPDERGVISLHLEEGLTFSEIAEVVGRPLNTVKSIYRRGVMKLRESLVIKAPK